MAYISETKFHCGAVSLCMKLVVYFSFSTCMLTYNSLLAVGGGPGERERERERATNGMNKISISIILMR